MHDCRDLVIDLQIGSRNPGIDVSVGGSQMGVERGSNGIPRIARVDHASCQIVVAEMNALVDGIGDDPQGIYGDTDEAGVLTKDVLFACILGKLPYRVRHKTHDIGRHDHLFRVSHVGDSLSELLIRPGEPKPPVAV